MSRKINLYWDFDGTLTTGYSPIWENILLLKEGMSHFETNIISLAPRKEIKSFLHTIGVDIRFYGLEDFLYNKVAKDENAFIIDDSFPLEKCELLGISTTRWIYPNVKNIQKFFENER